jgi:hypothetical protein
VYKKHTSYETVELTTKSTKRYCETIFFKSTSKFPLQIPLNFIKLSPKALSLVKTKNLLQLPHHYQTSPPTQSAIHHHKKQHHRLHRLNFNYFFFPLSPKQAEGVKSSSLKLNYKLHKMSRSALTDVFMDVASLLKRVFVCF